MSEMIRKNEPFMVQQDYQDLIRQVGCDLEAGRMQVISAVNSAMVRTYWMIGQHIVEYEQKGHEKADYGSGLLDQLSEDLSRQYGNGFGRSNDFLHAQVLSALSKNPDSVRIFVLEPLC